MQYKEEQNQKQNKKSPKKSPKNILHGSITGSQTQVEDVCVFVWGRDRRWMSSPHAAGEPIKISLRDHKSEVGQSAFDWQVSAGGLCAGEGDQEEEVWDPARLGVPSVFVDWALLFNGPHYVTGEQTRICISTAK